MRKSEAAPLMAEPRHDSARFDEGYNAAQTVLSGLAEVGPMSCEQLQWMSGFVQAFLEAASSGKAASAVCYETQSSGTRVAGVATEAVAANADPYTARIAHVDVTAAAGGESWLTVTLDVEGSPLNYPPGSTLALWPTNDPEEVRKVLRALGVSAQLQVPTTRGAEPAWQVLLERLNLSASSRQTIELLAEYSRLESEAAGLMELGQAHDAELEGRSLLSLLRRFPSTRPPFERLLTTLSPLSPTLLPIASSFADTPNSLQFSARLSENPAEWGELKLALKSRFRVGEWVTVSIDEHKTELPVDDDLAPIIVLAEGPCLAFARALSAERRARQAKGRTWVIDVGAHTPAFPYTRELMSWNMAGAVGRYDVTTGSSPEDVTRLLEEKEDTLWRWIVDHSQVCLVTNKPEIRSKVSGWFVSMLARRLKLDRPQAETRLDELRSSRRFVDLPT